MNNLSECRFRNQCRLSWVSEHLQGALVQATSQCTFPRWCVHWMPRKWEEENAFLGDASHVGLFPSPGGGQDQSSWTGDGHFCLIPAAALSPSRPHSWNLHCISTCLIDPINCSSSPVLKVFWNKESFKDIDDTGSLQTGGLWTPNPQSWLCPSSSSSLPSALKIFFHIASGFHQPRSENSARWGGLLETPETQPSPVLYHLQVLQPQSTEQHL